jgi:hypothetical protein
MDAVLDLKIDAGQVTAAARQLDLLTGAFQKAARAAGEMKKASSAVDDATRNLSRGLTDQNRLSGPLDRTQRGYDGVSTSLDQLDEMQRQVIAATSRSPVARSGLGQLPPAVPPGTPWTPIEAKEFDKEGARNQAPVNEEEKKRWEEFSGGARGGVSTILKEISKGKNVADAVTSGARAFGDKLIDMSVNSVFDQIFGKTSQGPNGGGVLGMLFKWLFPSAKGNVFGPGGVQAFANGGIVSQPTLFPFANGGIGLMGEAGAEAIMPLRRNASGQLGVIAAAASSSQRPGVIVNNYNGGQVREQTAPDGSTVIDIFPALQSALASDVSTGQGSLGSAIQGRFGVSQNGNLRG